MYRILVSPGSMGCFQPSFIYVMQTMQTSQCLAISRKHTHSNRIRYKLELRSAKDPHNEQNKMFGPDVLTADAYTHTETNTHTQTDARTDKRYTHR